KYCADSPTSPLVMMFGVGMEFRSIAFPLLWRQQMPSRQRRPPGRTKTFIIAVLASSLTHRRSHEPEASHRPFGRSQRNDPEYTAACNVDQGAAEARASTTAQPGRQPGPF